MRKNNTRLKTARHIKDLVPDAENRRSHNPRNIGMIVDGLHAVGAARSIVIDEGNTVLAGNGVVDAAIEAGITKVQVVDVDGSTLVAVRRSGLTHEQKRSLAMFDNRTGELSTWNSEQVKADVEAGLDLKPFWTEQEIARLLNQTDNPAEHWDGMPEFHNEDETAWKSVVVHLASKADLEAFSRLVNQTVTERTRSLWYPQQPEVKASDAAWTEDTEP